MAVTQVTHWPNAERVVKDLLAAVRVDDVPVVRVGRETAPGDQFATPCIRVERTGGAINRDFTADTAVIEVACFGATFDQAQDMSTAVARLFEDAVGERIGPEHDSAVLDAARQEAGPVRPAWGQNARRDITSWRLTWRPRVTH